MTRTIPQWQGKTPDTAPPPRVKLRVFQNHDGRCHICKAKILAGDQWDTDHVIRIRDGGKNIEGNIAPAHKRCHARKTASENTQQAVEDRKAKKHLGIKKATSRPLPGTKASGWKRKMNGEVERR